MKRFFLFLILPLFGKSQFAPAAGQPGTTAVKKDSSIIVNWATNCKVVRGLQDISNLASGDASYGDSSKAIGPADGADVVSLGDGGYAILTFQSPITNGPGNDFCVFENSFDPGFLELAFVEVSSDGVNFTRFAATCNVQNTVQIGPFDTTSDPAKINNLAGKYVGNYGVPFDLQELQGTAGLDINQITHVKLIDVVGCIQPQYARYDQNNNAINDLWSTPFPSCGFDLDAVGVMHQQPLGWTEEKLVKSVLVYPAVSNGKYFISNQSGNELWFQLLDIQGRVLTEEKIQERNFELDLFAESPGIYFLRFREGNSIFTRKITKVN